MFVFGVILNLEENSSSGPFRFLWIRLLESVLNRSTCVVGNFFICFNIILMEILRIFLSLNLAKRFMGSSY